MATSTATTFWPDATNTGVPAGTTLTKSGQLVINTAGAVISGLDISGGVIINAPNVTLENCKISSSGFYVVQINALGATVQNCTIDGLGGGGEGISGAGTFIANNITGCVDGINVCADNTVIENNYIHGMSGPSSAHFDTIQADGNFSNILIQHNTLVNEQTQTSVIMLDNYWGSISNVTINDNLLVGGGYTTYINEMAQGQPGGGTVTNVTYTNNHIGSGYYGPLDLVMQLGDQPVISGNTSDGNSLLATLNTSANQTGGQTLPAVPTISTWSPDTGVSGDGITDASKLTIAGSAAAGSTVNVYDGSTLLGKAAASSTGAWSFATAALANGAHKFTATDTVSGATSAASAAVTVTVDTVAPAAPVEKTDAIVNGDQVNVAGTAEANSTVKVYDGTTLVGTGAAGSTGAWSATTSALSVGSHALTATATDAAGNVSAASAALDPVIAAATPQSPINFTGLWDNFGGGAAIHGVADPLSKVEVYEGSHLVGTTTASSSGKWGLWIGALSNTIHAFTAREVSASGAVLATSSGQAIVGTTGSDVLKSTSGNDVFVGAGSLDTYVFTSGFGHDVILDNGIGDTFKFSNSEFASYSDLMSHASQIGENTVITKGNDSLTMVNTPLTSLVANQFHFV